MRSRPFATFFPTSVALTVVAAASCSEAPAGPAAWSVREIVLERPDGVRGGGVSDTLFGLPTDVAATADGVVVTDLPTATVRVLDRDFDLVAVLGRPGMGPGEMRAPTAVQSMDERIFVLDPGASRISVWRNAEFERHVPMPRPNTSFGVLRDGTFVLPGGPEGIGFTVFDGSGDPLRSHRIAARERSVLPEEMASGHSYVAVHSDTVLVVNETAEQAWLLDPSGEMLERVELPADVLQAHREYQERRDAGFGDRVRHTQTFSDVTLGPGGVAIVAMGGEGVLGFLLDFSRREVGVLRQAVPEGRIGHPGWSAALDEHALIELRGEGITRYPLERLSR